LLGVKKEMPVETVFLGTEPEAAVVRAYLELNGIKAMLEGVNVAIMAPHVASPRGSRSVKVIVSQRDAERARVLITERQKGT